MPTDHGHGGSHGISGGFVNCPHCGCPNREDDILCSFCKTSLRGKPGIIRKARLAIEQMKWRRKSAHLRKRKVVSKANAHPAVAFIVGIALLGLGWLFFVKAVGSAGYSDFLTGALSLMYGGRLVWSLFRKQR